MRTGLVSGVLAAAAVIFTMSSAQADTWCRNGTMCVFSSYQQCASAIRVTGGVCTREQSRYTQQPRSSNTGRSSYAQYSSTPFPTNLHPTRFSCSNL